jgi:hypothetical protein
MYLDNSCFCTKYERYFVDGCLTKENQGEAKSSFGLDARKAFKAYRHLATVRFSLLLFLARKVKDAVQDPNRF